MVEQRVREFIRRPDDAEFNDLALAAFRWQCERSPKLRSLAMRRGHSPGELRDWREIPLVPTRSFKTTQLHTSPPQVIFRSSGTTQPRRSVHPHGHLDLYREVIEQTFPSACLPAAPPVPMLSLIPSTEALPDSSLAFMIDHVLRRFGTEWSAVAIGARGVEFARARSWMGKAQRHGQAVVVLATGLALKQLLDVLQRRDLRFRLPRGSVLFETGGTKGRVEQISRQELLAMVHEHLALSAEHVIREYGMTELTSHFYTAALRGGDPDLFIPPPWTRVRVLDAESLQPLTAGKEGLLAIFDLANLSSTVHLLSEDLGVLEDNGFRLTGRAEGAALRGCSLAAEEFAQLSPSEP